MASRAESRLNFLATTPWRDAAMHAFKQDASFRQYFRLQAGPKPALLMDAPTDKGSIKPFVTISKHLQKLGLSAPQIYRTDEKNGFVLLEDFGDQTFTRLLAQDREELSLYLLATDCLTRLHNHKLATKIELPHREQTQIEEALIFCDWFYPALYGKPCPQKSREQYIAAWQSVLAQRVAGPDVLVLRDFHVDNAMLLSDRSGVQRCGLLDFQDAAIGPAAYDFMSLLEDARRDVSTQTVDACRQRYLENSQVIGSTENFATDCAIFAAQRHTRIAGIFMRLYKRDGKKLYLQHLPRVTRLLRGHLDHPALDVLERWFMNFCPDFDAGTWQL
jgi:aminoglycoside/choline kinase family phosphotransferase